MTENAAPAKRERTPAAWAKLIRADLQKAVEGIVRAGQHLIEAKEEIEHGLWEGWLQNEVGITQPTAYKLMSIARNEALANHSHANDLPPSWTTLGELAPIPAPALTKAIEDGRVYREMQRKDATKLAKLIAKEDDGTPVSNGSHGGARTGSPAAPEPAANFWTYVQGLVRMDAEQVANATDDIEEMFAYIEDLRDFLVKLEEILQTRSQVEKASE